MTGNEFVLDSTYKLNFGESLLFEPMGLEFLRGDAKKPQVLVTVNGIVALCPNDNCDYSYVSSTAAVTGQSLSGS